ncbi:conserved membrane protein of unknown function [Petrocella atlantisensis]|uniref:DUF1385 domain-containing protein n=1 Tax=Petrocella atlantisensis TaxID=2173034 RepID=A0A3P7PUI2_9FIRM|nr:DUF1385 domain-containing protein [Petrocella atlantisensis]VDN46861.1 conserved membrane protein of unknown function [Petrocella atlantisensis]
MERPSIGGQAVIEGVMMRNNEKYATAVRTSDQKIVLDKREYVSLTKRYKILGLPLIRGGVAFLESMVIGMKILTFSAEFFEVEGEEEAPSKFEKFLEAKFGDRMNDIVIVISMVLALALSIGLFFIVPAFLSQIMGRFLPEGRWMNLMDGIIRILILIGYIFLISKMKDIQRVFEYHGAEHKTINCYESGDEVTIENVMKHSRFHKRCGTNFIFIIVTVSIVVLTIINVQTFWLRIGVRLLALPLIAGISYELLKIFGKFDNGLINIFASPGMALQRITTSEPDESQVEIAITAFMNVLEEDTWKDEPIDESA